MIFEMLIGAFVMLFFGFVLIYSVPFPKPNPKIKEEKYVWPFNCNTIKERADHLGHLEIPGYGGRFMCHKIAELEERIEKLDILCKKD